MKATRTVKALPSLVSFEVLLVNRYRQRKKRFLVIDTDECTLSRSNRDDSKSGSLKQPVKQIEQEEAGYESDQTTETAYDLRKTIPITQNFMLLPSEVNKRKLRLFVDPHTRPLEIVFEDAAAREQFSTIIRTLRSVSSLVGNGSTGSPVGNRKGSLASIDELKGSGSLRKMSVASNISAAPSRLSVFCTTYNVSKEGVPEIVARNSSSIGEPESGKEGHLLHEQQQQRPHKISESSGSSESISDGDSLGESSKGEKTCIPLSDIQEWIPPDEFDLYFIALQECRSKHFPDWQQLILNLINRKLEDPNRPSAYKLLTSTSMWGIHSMIIVKERLAKHFSHIHTDSRACGLGGVMGNKGAVGISVQYGDGTSATSTSFAFVNAHLAARAERLPHRAQNYAEICHSLLTRRKKGHLQGVQLLHAYDHIFWVGDLNYRNDMGSHGQQDEFEGVKQLIKDDKLHILSPHDQLGQERAKHNVFIGFREGELSFPPTYRLEHGRFGEYNNKRNQNPSWTDRILWRSLPGSTAHVEQVDYYCADAMVYSDHRPVCGCFSVLTACASNGGDMDELESKMETAISARRAATMRRATSRQLSGRFAMKGSPSGRSISVRFTEVSSRTIERQFSEMTSVTGEEDEDEEDDEKDHPAFKISQLEFFSKCIDEKQAAALDLLNHENTALKNRVDIVDTDDEDGSGGEDVEISDQQSSGESRRRSTSRTSWGARSNSSSQSKDLVQGKRRNSYRRPMNSMDLTNVISKSRDRRLGKFRFKGKGFASGEGSLMDSGINCCKEDSPEFARYVSKANSGVHSPNAKLWVRFHGAFLEDTAQSASVAATTDAKMSSYFKYTWPKGGLPVVRPFIYDQSFLSDHQIVVTIHRPAPHLSGAFRQGHLVGQAHIPLTEITNSRQSWFVVPVLLNGLPAGILRGQLENPSVPLTHKTEIQTPLKKPERFSSPSKRKEDRLSTVESFAEDDDEDTDHEDPAAGQEENGKEDLSDEEQNSGVPQGIRQRKSKQLSSKRFTIEEGEEEEENFGNLGGVEDLSGITPIRSSTVENSSDSPSVVEELDSEQSSRFGSRRSSRPISFAGGRQNKSVASDESLSNPSSRLSQLLNRVSLNRGSGSGDEGRSTTSTSTVVQVFQAPEVLVPQSTMNELKGANKCGMTRGTPDTTASTGFVVKDFESDKADGIEKSRRSSGRGRWISKRLSRPFFQSTSAPTPASPSSSVSSAAAPKEKCRTYKYEDLLALRFELNLDQSMLESYLEDDDFQRVLGMSRSAFMALPKWKRQERKKKAKLF